MQLLPLFSKNSKKKITESEVKSQLGLVFTDIMKEGSKARKRRLNIMEINLLRQLEGKPAVKFKTKRIFSGFRFFLEEFEK